MKESQAFLCFREALFRNMSKVRSKSSHNIHFDKDIFPIEEDVFQIKLDTFAELISQKRVFFDSENALIKVKMVKMLVLHKIFRFSFCVVQRMSGHSKSSPRSTS